MNAGWKFTADKPIYMQIIEHVRQKIVSGEYKCAQQLPTVRELAAEAGVNPNTVQRAMSELEETGLIHSNRTSGRFITDDEKLIAELKKELALSELDGFFGKMRQLGFDKEQIVLLLNDYKGNEYE